MIESISAVFIASLLGSGHCVGMCGGLAACYGCHAKSLASYHLGRFFSYATLGAAAGILGKSLNAAGELAGLQHAALLLSGVLLLLSGLGVLYGAIRGNSQGALGTWVSARLSSVLRHPALATLGDSGKAFIIGVLSGALPCGWLWAFVILAAGTGSALYGALTMIVFWAGSVPALTAVGGFAALLRVKLRPYAPRITGFALIFAGCLSLYHHANHIPHTAATSDDLHCH